jgi:hypothetical protein
MPLRTLPISDMHQRHPGLTQALAAAYVEAASVCLDRGNNAMVGRRLRAKVLQALKGKSNLPAIACVVGFQAARIAMESVEAEYGLG